MSTGATAQWNEKACFNGAVKRNLLCVYFLSCSSEAKHCALLRDIDAKAPPDSSGGAFCFIKLAKAAVLSF